MERRYIVYIYSIHIVNIPCSKATGDARLSYCLRNYSPPCGPVCSILWIGITQQVLVNIGEKKRLLTLESCSSDSFAPPRWRQRSLGILYASNKMSYVTCHERINRQIRLSHSIEYRLSLNQRDKFTARRGLFSSRGRFLLCTVKNAPLYYLLDCLQASICKQPALKNASWDIYTSLSSWQLLRHKHLCCSVNHGKFLVVICNTGAAHFTPMRYHGRCC